MYDFRDKRVLITGGSSGAGKGLAQAILARGGRVVLIARDGRKLQAAREELGATDAIEVASCDVADAAQVQEVFGAIVAAAPVDVLVNSAGVISAGPFDTTALAEYRRIIDINFFGVLHCVHALMPHLRSRARADIVNVASLAGLLGVYGYGAYCASKHALVGLSETMRVELLGSSVHVHLVCPPEFDSPMVEGLDQHRSPESRAMAQTAGVLTVDEVVTAVLRAVERDRFLSIPGRNARMTVAAARAMPAVGRAVVDRLITRARNRHHPSGNRQQTPTQGRG